MDRLLLSNSRIEILFILTALFFIPASAAQAMCSLADSTIVINDTLRASKVVSEVKVLQFNGDTLVYNVAGTQSVARGEMLSDVLSKLPGVDCTENANLKIMGESISKIFINGKLVFGDNIKSALSYLAGSEVVSIKVFDRLPPSDSYIGRRTGKKERVIDVKTKHLIDNALICQAIVSAGCNMRLRDDGTDVRYHANSAGNYFSEKNMLSANVSIGNIGRVQNEIRSLYDMSSVPQSYVRSIYAGVAMVKKFGDAEMGDVLNASFSYGNDKRLSSSSETRGYYILDNVLDHVYQSKSFLESRAASNTLDISFKSHSRWVPYVKTRVAVGKENMWTSREKNESLSGRISNNSESYSKRIASEITVEKIMTIAERSFFRYSAYFSGGRDTGSEWQRDSSSGLSTTYFSSPVGRHINTGIGAELIKVFSNERELTTAYSFKYKNITRRADKYLSSSDELLMCPSISEDYTNNGFDNQLSVSYGRQNGLSVGLTGYVYCTADNWRTPLSESPHRVFAHVSPTLSFGHSSPTFNSVFLDFRSIQGIPSKEQLYPAINNGNTSYIIIGNPDLKQSREYQLNIASSITVSSNTAMRISAAASVSTGSIISDINYCRNATYINGYEVSPGTTVSTWCNSDKVSSAVYLQFLSSSYVKALRSRIIFTAEYNFNSGQNIVSGSGVTTYRHSPSVKLQYLSAFSRNYTVEAIVSESPVFCYDGSRQKNIWYDQRLQIKSHNSFTPWLFLNASFIHSSRLSNLNVKGALQSNILNAILGFRLLDGDLELSLSCYDILGSSDAFKTQKKDDYILTAINASYGRVVLFNVVYHFNSTQHGGKKIYFGAESMKVGKRYDSPKDYDVIY